MNLCQNRLPILLSIAVAIALAAGIFYFSPKYVCIQASSDFDICEQKAWHKMDLDSDLLNYTIVYTNHTPKHVDYNLHPKVYFASNANITATTAPVFPISLDPGKSDQYRFYGVLDQGDG